jgi:NTE family protein
VENAKAPRLAVVLSGGGARAAYQAGVLAAIADMLPAARPLPFRIVCGTSAGAINAGAIAAGARHFRAATHALCDIWSRLHVHDIYRSDAAHLVASGGRWFSSMLPGLGHRRPRSLLDNAPLAELLTREIRFNAIHDAIDSRLLDALTVTASSYTTGLSVSFCTAGPDIAMWQRAQRVGIRTDIRVPHLVASTAIPFVFAPMRIGDEYFGDGAVRQVAPTAPALHLGADRILVIGAARASEDADAPRGGPSPSVAQIGGHVLSSIFTDALGTDLEKVRLINIAVGHIGEERLAARKVPMWNVQLIAVAPSTPLEDIALEHVGELPRAMRILLGSLGGTREGGSGLLSYLLFEQGFMRRLIAEGRRDAEAKRDELLAFFDGAL